MKTLKLNHCDNHIKIKKIPTIEWTKEDYISSNKFADNEKYTQTYQS